MSEGGKNSLIGDEKKIRKNIIGFAYQAEYLSRAVYDGFEVWVERRIVENSLVGCFS